MAVRWVEITDTESEKIRFDCLRRELSQAGIENEFEVLKVDADSLAATLAEAKHKYNQIRLGGSLREAVVALSEKMPTSLLPLKCADALVRADGQWWPRNFLCEGFQSAFVADLSTLDLSGAVFILGSGCEARSLVGALIRIGFNRFSMCDPDEIVGQSLIEDLKKSYFKVRFDFVPRSMITQLPSVHSVSINTLAKGQDDGAITELFYFNFLKPGGVFLDLPLASWNKDLEAEAKAVGARVEPADRIFAWTDEDWVRLAFAGDPGLVKFDRDRLAQSLSEARVSASAASMPS